MSNRGDCANATGKLNTFFKEIPNSVNEIYKKAQKLDKKSILFFKQNPDYGIKRIFFEGRLYTLDELLNLPKSKSKFKKTREKKEKKLIEKISKNIVKKMVAEIQGKRWNQKNYARRQPHKKIST